ncbi:MAG: hypothetical protein IPN45_05550 [Actinomycetales bacterium]|nr:hypothetical protein [Actinomycetales bacterium]
MSTPPSGNQCRHATARQGDAQENHKIVSGAAVRQTAPVPLGALTFPPQQQHRQLAVELAEKAAVPGPVTARVCRAGRTRRCGRGYAVQGGLGGADAAVRTRVCRARTDR